MPVQLPDGYNTLLQQRVAALAGMRNVAADDAPEKFSDQDIVDKASSTEFDQHRNRAVALTLMRRVNPSGYPPLSMSVMLILYVRLYQFLITKPKLVVTKLPDWKFLCV